MTRSLSRMDPFMDGCLSDMALSLDRLWQPILSSDWASPATVHYEETDDAIHLQVELVAMDAADVTVELQAGQVVLQGYRDANGSYPYGQAHVARYFRQAIPLMAPVLAEQIRVERRQQTLFITLPKAHRPLIDTAWPRQSPRRIYADASDTSTTLVDLVQDAAQGMTQQWRRAKRWLGYQLQRWGRWLLQD